MRGWGCWGRGAEERSSLEGVAGSSSTGRGFSGANLGVRQAGRSRVSLPP